MNNTLIIAEAGVNHNGSIELARKMIHAAKQAGADYVKFQTAIPEEVISSIAEKADYQKTTTGAEESQLDMCRRIHLPLTDYVELKALCNEVGIGFMSTPFDLVSVRVLAELGQDFFKIPSGEITNLPYLRAVAATGHPIIMSTGMSTMEEIGDALHVLTLAGADRNRITLLHCNTEYPTPYEDVNLRAMRTMACEFGVPVGYSDHTRGIEVPIAAVAMGATVIEKHFTLSRQLEGPDHAASLEPDELAAMVRAIRNIEKALGDADKHVTPSEAKNINIARKSIVARCDIKAGELLTVENLAVKRPGTGLSPMLWDSVIGTRAVKDFPADSLIQLENGCPKDNGDS